MTIAEPPAPLPGRPEALGPGLRRLLAPNPSPMTLHGTNTYLLGTTDLAVIDPGPDDPQHLAAILDALRPGQRITHIFVTHAHLDHSPLARRLSQESGAPVLGYGDARAGRSEIMRSLVKEGLLGGGEGVDHGFVPDIALEDDAIVGGAGWQLRCLWTPGHFGNHLSFAFEDVVFSGDLVMGWASSLVSPPDGDLTDFMASCRRLRAVSAKVLHAGHGAPIVEPRARIDWLISHRLGREAMIRKALADGPANAAELTARIYTDTPQALRPAAERNVLAHLIDLCARRIARADGPLQATARFHLQPRAGGSEDFD
jgi:glyoxylase-like metal-dependent hydrolase (beta-lactamase superfamily II)